MPDAIPTWIQPAATLVAASIGALVGFGEWFLWHHRPMLTMKADPAPIPMPDSGGVYYYRVALGNNGNTTAKASRVFLYKIEWRADDTTPFADGGYHDQLPLGWSYDG